MKRIIILKSLLILLFFYQLDVLAQDKEYTLNELVSSSKCIVLGKVTKINSWVGGNGRIYSDIKFHVSTVYKGKIKQKQELNFSLLGGSIGSRRTTVFELPHFTENVESILFLRSIDDNYDVTNALVTIGGAQGKFDIMEKDNIRSICRDKFMSATISIQNGNEYKKVNNKQAVLLSEFVSQLESLIK